MPKTFAQTTGILAWHIPLDCFDWYFDKAGSRNNHYNALALIMMAQDFWLVEDLAPG